MLGIAFRTTPLTSGKIKMVENVATVGTSFGTGIEPINLDQFPSVPCGFVVELADELGPSGVTDSPCKGVVLHHVLYSKTLNDDRLVFADQFCRELVCKVEAFISDSCVDTGDPKTRFHAVARTSLLTAQAALSTFELPQRSLQVLGIATMKPVGRDSDIVQSKINADHAINGWQGNGIGAFAEYAHEVTIRSILCNGHRSRDAIYGTTPDDVKRLVHLRKAKNSPVELEGARCKLSALFTMLLLERWESAAFGEEGVECLFLMSESLLKRDAGDLSKPYQLWLLFQLRETRGQFLVSGVLAISVVDVRSKAQCPVPDKPAAAESLSEEGLLFLGRVKPISKRLLHAYSIPCYDVRVNPPMKGEWHSSVA